MTSSLIRYRYLKIPNARYPLLSKVPIYMYVCTVNYFHTKFTRLHILINYVTFKWFKIKYFKHMSDFQKQFISKCKFQLPIICTFFTCNTRNLQACEIFRRFQFENNVIFIFRKITFNLFKLKFLQKFLFYVY